MFLSIYMYTHILSPKVMFLSIYMYTHILSPKPHCSWFPGSQYAQLLSESVRGVQRLFTVYHINYICSMFIYPFYSLQLLIRILWDRPLCSTVHVVCAMSTGIVFAIIIASVTNTILLVVILLR